MGKHRAHRDFQCLIGLLLEHELEPISRPYTLIARDRTTDKNVVRTQIRKMHLVPLIIEEGSVNLIERWRNPVDILIDIVQRGSFRENARPVWQIQNASRGLNLGHLPKVGERLVDLCLGKGAE